MSRSMIIQSQLLATKFFIPVASHPLIDRPRLGALLQESLKYPLTLISASAGFGKTMLLASWAQSQSVCSPLVAWVSLDEEDNDPRLFWTYALSALDQQQPERFTPLLKYLQSSQAPSLRYVLIALTNLLMDSAQEFVLILDDYHVISEQKVHATLAFLIEHLPAHLHIILSTRTDPPLPLSSLRASRRLLEVHTDQLRCMTEETRAFFDEVMGIYLPDETIQQVTARTEGWLACLHLLGLSLLEHADPAILLEEISGDQRYILDYLTEVVLEQQMPDIQAFLLCTSILEQLTASLCDAIMQRADSRQMLQRLEQANLFVVSLDSKREWYRYHTLFTEALRYRLEQAHADLVPILHHRASIWYAEHDQTTQAILHALHAKEWQWAADLIERSPSLISFSWAPNQRELILLRRWLGQLPTPIVQSRPRICLLSAQILWAVGQPTMITSWLDAAETTLMATLTKQQQEDGSELLSQARQKQENLLGEVLALRAGLQTFEPDSQAVLSQCQRAFSLLAVDNFPHRAQVAFVQLLAFYFGTNDTMAAIQSGLQASSLAQAGSNTSLAITIQALTALYMIHAGQLHETEQLIQNAIQLGSQIKELVLPETGYPALFQAELLREWNQLDQALSVVQEAMALYQQTETMISPGFLIYGHAVQLRIALSRGELDAAHSALGQIEDMGRSMNQASYLILRCVFTTVDQVRLWLACGELDRAARWAEELDLRERYGTPFAHEREEVACIRILLAADQPAAAQQRLEPVLQRATTGQRWGHVIEVRLLQALALQMEEEEMQALEALSEAVRLAEPQGYIRSFVDEGALMAALLSQLREQQSKQGPTPYLDTLLAAFVRGSKIQKRRPKQIGQHRLKPNLYRAL